MRQRYYDKHRYCCKCEEWRDKSLRRCGVCHTLLRTKSHNNPYRHFNAKPDENVRQVQALLRVPDVAVKGTDAVPLLSRDAEDALLQQEAAKAMHPVRGPDKRK
jgi:hypothetical protein